MSNDPISLLAELVKIPSVCGEESEIANFIERWLKRKGLPVEMLEVKPNRPDVISRVNVSNAGPRILLNGHMDTVAPGEGWTHDPFAADVEEGKMYGRGTMDMKSGLACILSALAQCKEEGLPKRGELLVTAVVDEEAYDWGTYALIQKGFTKGVNLAMISEPTNLQIISAHRGRAVFEIEVEGKSAHSSTPERGVNAIERAGLLLNALQNIAGPTHPKMGKSTINTLKIEGGQEEVMLVPDRCRIVIERCIIPGYDSQTALKDLEELIRKVGIEAKVRFLPRETPRCDPYEIPNDDPNVQLVVGAAGRVLGGIPEIGFHYSPCDSCILVNQGRVPTLEFGPSGGRLHESDEFVEIESVLKTTEVYKEVIRTFMS